MTNDASIRPFSIRIFVPNGDPDGLRLVESRLKSHNSHKDFRDWCVFFVTKDNSLNKAHVQRMECRLPTRRTTVLC